MKRLSLHKKNSLSLSVVGIAFILAAIILPLYAVKVVLNAPNYTDFKVYYRAAARMQAQEWTQLYTLADQSCPLRYSPLFLPFLRPLAYLSPLYAEVFWYLLQYSCFFLGFWFLYKTLAFVAKHSHDRFFSAHTPLATTCFSFLFVLRFCLDALSIGQVSGIIFLCLSAALYAWAQEKSRWAAIGLFVPALLKIGPATFFGVFLAPENRRHHLRSLCLLLLVLLGALVLNVLWVGSLNRWISLVKNWWLMILTDSVYFDSSHYGSQSLNSLLLRLQRAFAFKHFWASLIFYSLAALTCGSLAFFWASTRALDAWARGLFLSLGVFPYLWFMPETFKYSLSTLAFPIAFLLSAREKTGFTCVSLAFAALTLSLPGKDIVGDFLFFRNQELSLPFFATVFLGLATFQIAWKERKKKEGKGLEGQAGRKLPGKITADDWGMSPAVNNGILQLAKKGIIRRVSVMAGTQFFRDHLLELSQVPGIELGLHFHLTHGPAALSESPHHLLIQWMKARLSRGVIGSKEYLKLKNAIRSQLHTQLELLRAEVPHIAYLDGHQHIHLIPGVLDEIIDILGTHGIRTVRLPYDPERWLNRKILVNLLALLAKRKFVQHKLTYFPFRYPDPRAFSNTEELRLYLLKLPQETEVLFHPASQCDFETFHVADSYREERVYEFQLLDPLLSQPASP